MKHKVIIFSAPAGSGKSTVVGHLLRKFPTLELSVSATSRAPRGEEVDGRDYYFLSVEDFEKRIAAGEFIEYEPVYKGSYYGTLKSEIERIWSAGHTIVFDVDVKGGINLKRILKDDALSVFIQAPSVEVLRQRLEGRGTDTPEAIETRLAKAAEEMSYAPQFDRILINDNLAECLSEAETLIEGPLTVALYFGTFNPLHKGHTAIIENLLKEGYDEVRLVVSPQSPFKPGAEEAANERLERVRRDVARLGLAAVVSDAEYHLPTPNYTVGTLAHLKQTEPDVRFVIAMGADNFAAIERWYNFTEIVDNYRILVYPRRGCDVTALCRKYGARLMGTPLVDISSTEIREGRGDKNLMI